MEDWTDQVEQALFTLDSLGVVVLISAGNDGKPNPSIFTDSYTPTILAAREDSPLIVVGAVNSDGQLAKITSAESDAVPINCYAMGKGIKIIDLSVEEDTKQDGTTFSAAIVVSAISFTYITLPTHERRGLQALTLYQGGLVACYLSHPDFSERFIWSVDDPKGATVGNRMKQWLTTEGQGAYQRVSADNILDGPRSDWRYVYFSFDVAAAYG